MNMLTSTTINQIFDIKESFQLPGQLSAILRDKTKREEVFESFLAFHLDTSFDWFTEYFQEQHANRDKMMQDYTPKEVCELTTSMCDSFESVVDICAGTGGLTIAAHSKQPNAFFCCVELSARSYPLLCFNLAIRNMNALAIRADVLSGEVFEICKITKGEIFSDIEALAKMPELPLFDFVIMNPPYSLKHQWNETSSDTRFVKYGFPPNNAADWGFVLHGLSLMKESGTLAAILPHGVLFRGGKEKTIRENLIKDNYLDTIIGLPEKLFLNTGIPVAILKFKKSKDILFINAEKCYYKSSKINYLQESHLEKIKSAVKLRDNVLKFSHKATYEEIKQNDYNLNIPRYVDTFEPETPVDLLSLRDEWLAIEEEEGKTCSQLLKMLDDLVTNDDQKQKELQIVKELIGGN